MHVVVDTSVAMAWYVQERFSSSAREWQDRMLEGEVHAMVPPLHYLEFANVLRTYVRRKELSVAMARDLYALHLDAPLDVVEAPRAILFDIAMQYETTAYDAALIGLAVTYQCPLITAERTTTPWVVKLGKQALTLG